MPPQYASYELSAHSRVSCVECHIGREFIGKQLPRKAEHTQFVFRMAFGAYEYPIYATSMRPAREACETCHSPDKFSDDSVRVNTHFETNEANTEYSIYLVMKTGGGTAREGLGRGIHWHIENKVQFLSTDELDQDIPYIRVTNDDGSVDEYVDVEADFDPASVDSKDLKTIDCITCHNRISHTIAHPVDSIESSMARGVISSDIPYIRDLGVQVLTREYANQEQADAGIAQALDDYYRTSQPEFYATGKDQLDDAIAEIQRIYAVSVFKDQELDWNTHPDNVGHIESAGCFRCHDGKHLDASAQAIRLECNICHSIPVVSGTEDLVTNIEISHGPEPASHRNPNWIALHNQVYDDTCANCHTTADDGGTSNTSFCSNSTCHGRVYTYAGFDAPALRQALQGQIPASGTVAPQPPTSGVPTWDSFFGPLVSAKCGTCHGDNPAAGLDLTTYAGAMQGGTAGPVIIPGDSAHSRLVEVQSQVHFSNLSVQELEAVKQWIDSGAPEN
jgi:mono/diheme cytochrome c family protein